MAGQWRGYAEIDVFASTPLSGNALAVVNDADGLSDAQMQAFAQWTQLSETTFLLAPTEPQADYRVRIFTPGGELPFAGHPTLGSCRAWLQRGGRPRGEAIVQQCAKGLVRIRRGEDRLAFEAPPMQQSALPAESLQALCDALGLNRTLVRDAALLDNGPQWAALRVDAAATVLALKPDFAALKALPKVGVIGARAPGEPCAFEVRAFAPGIGVNEDPVTGSLNASLAQWLIASGDAPAQYVAAQGSCIGRAGRVFVQRQDDGAVWVGGHAVLRVQGQVLL